MAKRILKIIGSLSIALVVALGSFFVPKLRTSEAECASADIMINSPFGSTETSRQFISNNAMLIQMARRDSNITSNADIFSKLLYSNGTYGSSDVKCLFGLTRQPDIDLYNNQSTSFYFYYWIKGSEGTLLVPYYQLNLYSGFMFSEMIFDDSFEYQVFSYSNPDSLIPFSNDGSTTGWTNIGIEMSFKGTEKVMPSLEIISLEICNSYEFESYFGYAPSFTNSNTFTFTDRTGWRFTFYIPSNSNATGENIETTFRYMAYTRYYYDEAFDLDNNDFYNQGLTDGYNDGYNVGETNGYNNGYGVGYSLGKNEGYSEGLEANSRLTFSGLMTSVIDVPVKVFVNLFDFDILGVNILVFLSTLLTICLVLFLIKKIKGA